MITSPQNAKVKQLIKLRERRERDRSGLFLIEGYRELLRAVDGGVDIVALYTCPSFFLGTNEDQLIAKIGEPLELASAIFKKVSYRDRPDGLLAIAKQVRHGLLDLEVSNNPFLVVCEAIEKPGNLGTILRSSDAAGVDGLIVCDQCTDIYNPNTVRASVGTLFTTSVVEATTEECLPYLQDKGIQIVAATPAADLEFTKADFRGPIAIAVGTEQLGLTEKWLNEADLKVRIPMRGVADSLNVAMATTILLYEVLRQRQ